MSPAQIAVEAKKLVGRGVIAMYVMAAMNAFIA
jgi:hypothetical protein